MIYCIYFNSDLFISYICVPEQLDRLETEFLKSEFAVADRKDALARELGVPARTVALWFQNSRAKHKRDQMKTACELSESN